MASQTSCGFHQEILHTLQCELETWRQPWLHFSVWQPSSGSVFERGKDPLISRCGSCQQSRVFSSLIWDREDRERPNHGRKCCQTLQLLYLGHCLQYYKYFMSRPHDRLFIFIITSDTFMTLIFLLDLIVCQYFCFMVQRRSGLSKFLGSNATIFIICFGRPNPYSRANGSLAWQPHPLATWTKVKLTSDSCIFEDVPPSPKTVAGRDEAWFD